MIAGPGADARRVDTARRVAEAEIDIFQVRNARTAVQQAAISDQYNYSISETRRRLKQMLSSYKKTPNVILADAIFDWSPETTLGDQRD